jgi:hypothetical protein
VNSDFGKQKWPNFFQILGYGKHPFKALLAQNIPCKFLAMVRFHPWKCCQNFGYVMHPFQMRVVHDVPNWTPIMLGTPFKLQLAHNVPIKKWL